MGDGQSNQPIHIAILDDHQLIIDGCRFYFQQDPQIEVVATANCGDAVWTILNEHQIDVLILDLSMPSTEGNELPFPSLFLIPKLLQSYPELNILVMSMHKELPLINNVLKVGANGYILKSDVNSSEMIRALVRTVAAGGIGFSPTVQYLLQAQHGFSAQLTQRQLEALSMVASKPNITTAAGALVMGVAPSTFRNFLSGAYVRLNVSNRSAAINKARQLNLITPLPPTYSQGAA